MNDPFYYPPGLLAHVALDILLLRQRNFHADAKACIQNINPPVSILGKENMPLHGPCVLTVNHYHRPGFGAQWFALAIAAAVPVAVHWIITAEFTDWSRQYGAPGAFASRLLLKRIARVYGFTTMPPMPPRSKDVAARAVAVRKVLGYVRRAHEPVLGFAPEGYDLLGNVVTQPAPGVGRFGLLLARAGLQFIPVGAYEADGVFQLHFGEPYGLNVEGARPVDEKDKSAAQIIMKKIACLLPFGLRGEFT